MAVTKSAQGRANRRKGHDTERDVAKYLRAVGFPHAERAVRTGIRTTDRTVTDPGDLTGIPGTVWSVKNDARNEIPRWLDEVEIARNHAGAELGILVVRRRGRADVSQWWAWVSLPALARAVTGPNVAGRPRLNGHACIELGDLIPVLHNAGYGDAETST